jgi:hypothetical protein
MKNFTVTITKKHCERASYKSHTNCPLAKAIKEQLPQFDLKLVGGMIVDDNAGGEWEIKGDDPMEIIGWGPRTMEAIISGKKESCNITLTEIS